jgi:hypothetical protein
MVSALQSVVNGITITTTTTTTTSKTFELLDRDARGKNVGLCHTIILFSLVKLVFLVYDKLYSFSTIA